MRQSQERSRRLAVLDKDCRPVVVEEVVGGKLTPAAVAVDPSGSLIIIIADPGVMPITSGREQIRALRSFHDQQKFRFLAPASSQPRPGATVIDFVNEAWPKETKSPIRSSEMSDG